MSESEVSESVRNKIEMNEHRKRSLVKAISWRAIATLTTMVLVFLFTGDLITALGIGFLEIISKLFFYYSHERVWNLISWGRNKQKLGGF